MSAVAVEFSSFMEMAHRVAGSSNCVRRAVGAVVVRNDQVIAKGWNGVPGLKGTCKDAGCPRCIQGGRTGSGYEHCICIHAEQKAIADAASRGINTAGAKLYVNLRPCLQCLAVIREAGITAVYFDEDWALPSELEGLYLRRAGEFEIFERAPVAV